MPIYEYECHGCRRRVSLLVMRPSTAPAPQCPRCGSGDLSRLMSRFASPKSEEARLDALGDPSSFGDLDESDPRSVTRFMKRMGEGMGEDLGEDMDAAMEEAYAEGGDGPAEGEGPAAGDDGGDDGL